MTQADAGGAPATPAEAERAAALAGMAGWAVANALRFGPWVALEVARHEERRAFGESVPLRLRKAVTVNLETGAHQEHGTAVDVIGRTPEEAARYRAILERLGV